MGTMRMGPLIFSMALPAMISMLINALYNIVDSIFVARYSASALTAVSLVFPLQQLVIAIAVGTGVGVNSLIARCLGAKDQEKADNAAEHGVVLSIVGGVVFILLGFLGSRPFLSGFTENTAVLEQAVSYSHIAVGLSIFVMVSIMCEKIQQSTGNMIIPMCQGLTGAIVNIILDPLLIFGIGPFPEMGIRGAALATVLGTVCACALSIASVLRKDSFINLRAVKGWIPEKQSRSSIGNVWSSSLVEQVCLRIGFLLFSMTVARLGTTELAAHQIGGNMMSMSFSFGDGLSVAAITLIGQSLGRKRPDMAKIYGSVCQRLGLVCACVMGFIYFFFGKEIFLLYSDDPVILDYGAMIMRILSVVLFMQIEQVVQFGCLRGAGDTKFTALVSFISVTFIRPGASWLLCYPVGLGLMGAWLGTALDQLVRFLLTFVRFRKGNWTKLKL